MSEEPTAVAEKVSTPEVVDFNEKHLEAAFSFRAKHHKGRILEGFKAEGGMSAARNGHLETRIVESERQFKKAYDLLNRERPVEVELEDGNLDRDGLIAVADNLAWTGIESSLVSRHLADIKAILAQLKHNGQQNEAYFRLSEAMKALKDVVVDAGHVYRDFFDSDVASSLGADSPAHIEKMLNRSSMYAADALTEDRAKGISLEIAARRYITDAAEEIGEEAIVEYGSAEDDKKGGDIVVVRDSGIVFFDLKSSRPDGMSDAEIEAGYSLYRDPASEIYKATVWPDSKQPVAHDSFRINDAALKRAIQKVLAATR